MTRSIGVLAMAACVTLVGAARATDYAVAGRRLNVRYLPGSSVFVSFTLKDASIVVPPTEPSGDTRARAWTPAGGFGFTVYNARWLSHANGKVFTLDNLFHTQRAVLKNGYLKVKADVALPLDNPPQGSVGVSFTMNDDTRYCAVFGGTVRTDEVGRFRAKDAPAPASCPDLCADDTADPTVTITGTSHPNPGQLFVGVDAADDRELHHVAYSTYDLVGCASGTPCDAGCWTRGNPIDAVSCYCTAGAYLIDGNGSGCPLCVEASVIAVDSCGRSSPEAIVRTAARCS